MVSVSTFVKSMKTMFRVAPVRFPIAIASQLIIPLTMCFGAYWVLSSANNDGTITLGAFQLLNIVVVWTFFVMVSISNAHNFARKLSELEIKAYDSEVTA